MTTRHKAAAARLRIVQVRSQIGNQERVKRVLTDGLGLGRIGSSVVLVDNPYTRGMIAKVAHIVRFEELAAEAHAVRVEEHAAVVEKPARPVHVPAPAPVPVEAPVRKHEVAPPVAPERSAKPEKAPKAEKAEKAAKAAKAAKPEKPAKAAAPKKKPAEHKPKAAAKPAAKTAKKRPAKKGGE